MYSDGANNCSDIYTKHLSVRVVSGISCSASILGSTLIILSYLCFKKLRTRVREILVHLSVADAGVATANLVGVVVYFDHYYTVECDQEGNVHKLIPPANYINNLCVAQAFFAVYFTLCSILWTVSLAVYLYFILVHNGTRNAKLFLVFAYVFCYSLPLLLSLWAAMTHRLGYSPYDSAGWCSLILVNPVSKKRDVFMGVIGYDLWIYLALGVVSILYLAMKSFLREELERTKQYVPREQFWKAVNVLEYKFLSIPIAFFLLRMWTCIINLVYVYVHIEKPIPQALIYLSGIGDSGQGIVNAFLFVLLTKPVRDSFLQPFRCRFMTKGKGQTAETTESCENDLLVNDKRESRLSQFTDSEAATPDPVT